MRESLSPLFAFDGVAPDKRIGEGVLSPNEPVYTPPKTDDSAFRKWGKDLFDQINKPRTSLFHKLFGTKPGQYHNQRQEAYERWSRKDMPLTPNNILVEVEASAQALAMRQAKYEQLMGARPDHVIIDELARNEKFEAFRKQVATDFDDYAKPHPLADKHLALKDGEMVWTDVDPPFHPTPANSHLHTDDCPFGPYERADVTITTSHSADVVNMSWDYASAGYDRTVIAVGTLEEMRARFNAGEGTTVSTQPDGSYILTE